jgi:ectoine hydroxylase
MSDNPLTAEDVARYQEDGYLLCPGLLPEKVVSDLAAAVTEIVDTDGPERILERDRKAVRSVYGPHASNPFVARLVRRPELVGAARQLIGTDELYVHQSKVNVKAPFVGDAWEWHQDYIYWLTDDGIQRPALVNMAVFLDDVTEFSGPITMVPGSHHRGVLAAGHVEGLPVGYEDAPDWVATLTSKEKYGVRQEVIAELVKESGMVSAKASRGSVLFFHPNVLHSSAPNISPFGRTTLIVVYNAVDNPPTNVDNPRPEFLAARKVEPLS